VAGEERVGQGDQAGWEEAAKESGRLSWDREAAGCGWMADGGDQEAGSEGQE